VNFMSDQKLLSVVVPTLNRRPLLEKTLDYLAVELVGFEEFVELVIVDNASEDDTCEFLRQWGEKGLGHYVSYDHRVDIDSSFARCVDVCEGRYINIFGDDDVPMPGFIRQLVDLLQSDSEPALVYFNRLIGDESLMCVSEVGHPNLGIDIKSYDISTFIREFTHHASFITSLVFSRRCWIEGALFSSDDFLGYKFLGRVYAGAKFESCIYVGLPAVIQRRGIQSWKRDWPRYWLVNMPRLLSRLEMEGITRGALDQWRSKEVSIRRLIIDCLVAKAFGYSICDPFWSLASKFQGGVRALLVQIVRYVVPSLLVSYIYFRIGKYRSLRASSPAK
jgi:glycosyltransferase involved in cell wall biosynthesis